MSMELHLEEVSEYVKSEVFYQVYNPSVITDAINRERKKGYKAVSIHYFHPYESYTEELHFSEPARPPIWVTKYRPQCSPNCYIIFEKIL